MTRTVLLTFACFALSIAPALAARIYNLTPLPITVRDQGKLDGVKLQPGQRSGSLSWGSSRNVGVYDEHGTQICALNFGPYNEVVGGNYLLVTNRGRHVGCQLCDSDGKRMYAGSGEFGVYWNSLVRDTASEKQGCP